VAKQIPAPANDVVCHPEYEKTVERTVAVSIIAGSVFFAIDCCIGKTYNYVHLELRRRCYEKTDFSGGLFGICHSL
jgi:hypothetical protein